MNIKQQKDTNCLMQDDENNAKFKLFCKTIQ